MDISQRVLTRAGDHKRAFSSWLLLLQAACEGAGGMLAAVQTLAQHEVRWPETERGGVAGRQRERRSHTGATHNMHKTRHISRSTREPSLNRPRPSPSRAQALLALTTALAASPAGTVQDPRLLLGNLSAILRHSAV